MIAGALAVAAFGVGGAALAAAALDGRLNFAVVGPTDTAVAAPSASVVGTPTATPSRSPTPTATPTASAPPSSAPGESVAATPAPTPVATPAPPVPPPATPVPPPPQQTYTVQQGDTLALVAQQFGTTVEALQAANGIDDPDEIVIGQILVIP
jgi:LysM repeat protein